MSGMNKCETVLPLDRLQIFNNHACQIGTEKSWTQSNRKFNTLHVIK